LNFKETGDDGQQMMKLISFEKDLIGIKEAKTGRLSTGDVTLRYETLDHRIGISDRRFANFIPGVGICAITNDDGEFRFFGFDQLWHSNLNGVDAGRAIQVDTAAISATYCNIVYHNGKIWISDGTGNYHVFFKERGMGWSKYEYRMNSTAQLTFTFANGSRIACASKSTYLVEMEIDDLNTDMDTNDETAYTIDTSLTTWKYQSNDGADILDQIWYQLRGKFSKKIQATPYINGETWPDPTSATTSKFVTPPTVNASNPALQEREYRLYLEPSTINTINFCTPKGNYIHYKIDTQAPAVLHSQALRVSIVENIGWGDFDPYQKRNFASSFPSWASNVILVLSFDETSGDTAFDGSGNDRDHEYNVT
jgi:hypothetical protein